MSTDDYYSRRVRESRNPLWQVGKTVNGEPVSEAQIDLIVEQISTLLSLTPSDCVLDIGAGNGLLTRRVARRCRQVTGIERNADLVREAEASSAGERIAYICGSLMTQDWQRLAFSKVYLYEVAQHLSYSDMAAFLARLSVALPPGGRVLIGGVPNALEQWSFYGEGQRLRQYLAALADGADVMGTWFHPQFFNEVARSLGLVCRIHAQPEALYTQGYRFDCVLEKPEA
ncbi:class I SAM-dependent methyltransferase [Marinobacter sp. C2H3]|uniref:class I SAM-dependent methyltransferase n=1 Tax=Marinobacter sp. C2H3 TaxID=3119003 RepID=UPI00300F44CF